MVAIVIPHWFVSPHQQAAELFKLLLHPLPKPFPVVFVLRVFVSDYFLVAKHDNARDG